MKLSVIVPVYNAEPYIEKCVNSVFAQSFKNIELLLIDDGSTDNSGKICDVCAKKDKRVRVFHIENGGPAKARNLGIEEATGEIISFVDADDYICDSMAEKMLNSIGTSDFVMCSYFLCHKDRRQVCSHNLGNSVFAGKEQIEKIFVPGFYYGKINGLGSCCNKYYVKSFLDDNNIRFKEQLIRAEDFWFNFDCISAAKSITVIEDALYCYMQVNSNSTMHQLRDNQYEDWKYTREELIKRSGGFSINIDYNEFYKNFLFNVSVYIVQRLRKNPKDKKVLKILNDGYYSQVIKYRKCLPKHIKFLTWLAEKNTNAAYIFYCLWAKVL